MLRYQYKGEQWGPIIVCDYCQRRITDSGLAAALTKTPIDGETVVGECLRYDILHVHKGPCLDAAENLPGVRAGWHELNHHLIKLVYNVKFPPEEMLEIRNDLQDFELNFG